MFAKPSPNVLNLYDRSAISFESGFASAIRPNNTQTFFGINREINVRQNILVFVGEKEVTKF